MYLFIAGCFWAPNHHKVVHDKTVTDLEISHAFDRKTVPEVEVDGLHILTVYCKPYGVRTVFHENEPENSRPDALARHLLVDVEFVDE